MAQGNKLNVLVEGAVMVAFAEALEYIPHTVGSPRLRCSLASSPSFCTRCGAESGRGSWRV